MKYIIGLLLLCVILGCDKGSEQHHSKNIARVFEFPRGGYFDSIYVIKDSLDEVNCYVINFKAAISCVKVR